MLFFLNPNWFRINTEYYTAEEGKGLYSKVQLSGILRIWISIFQILAQNYLPTIFFEVNYTDPGVSTFSSVCSNQYILIKKCSINLKGFGFASHGESLQQRVSFYKTFQVDFPLESQRTLEKWVELQKNLWAFIISDSRHFWSGK